MVIHSGLRRLIAGSAALVLGSVLLVSPAQAASTLKSTDFYNPLKILRVELELPPATVAALNDTARYRSYAPGSVTLSVDGRTSQSVDMEIRLKGSTSLRRLDETPSFKIKFPKGASGTGYLGLRRLTLNALTQDGSKIHEYGAYALFNAMGVPASKTGWARVYVNGIDRGLYLNIEQPDENFMAKKFKDITQHIYEGIALRDLKPGNSDGDNKSGAFLVDYGWKVTPNKNDLNKLIRANYEEDAAWYKALDSVVDKTSMLKFMAVENFLGHWDGYSGPLANNYFLRSNTRGVFTFIPWGTDQTFGENRSTDNNLGPTFGMSMLSSRSIHPWNKYSAPRGNLYVKCISYVPCRNAYLTQLKAVSAMATKMKLGTLMKSAATVIKPVLLETYPLGLYQATQKEQTRTISFIANRQKEVAALVTKYKIK